MQIDRPRIGSRSAIKAARIAVEELGARSGEAPRREEEARVALARKLGVVLHRMGVDGTSFRWSSERLALA